MLVVIFMHLTHIYDYMFTFTATKNNLRMFLLATHTGMPMHFMGSWQCMYQNILSECVLLCMAVLCVNES